jgi:hypothetical protein
MAKLIIIFAGAQGKAMRANALGSNNQEKQQ